MIKQKYVYVQESDGQYFNFFFTPGSWGSLANHLAEGWVVKILKDDPVAKEAVIILEKEIRKKK